MDYYKTTLDSLYYLLDITGVDFWAERIAEDIRLWEQEESVSRYVQSFGGMGSFNDVVICVLNGHKISVQQEPWANALLNELQRFSAVLAQNISKGFYLDINKIKKTFSRYEHRHIQGARCLTCGFSVLNAHDIDNYIAPQIVFNEILNGLENNQLDLSVSKCLAADLKIIEQERARIGELINHSPVVYKEHFGFMRPCDSCGSDDTAVYRWMETTRKTPFIKDETIFTASKDNLPLRRK